MFGTAREAMSSELVTISPDATLREAEQRLLRGHVTELFVTDLDGTLLGVIPDYELLKARVLGDATPRLVRDVMSAHPAAATPETPLADLACRLRMHVHHRIPIVEGSRLVGVVTRRHVLERMAERPLDEAPLPAREPSLRTIAAAGRPAPPNFMKSLRTAVAAEM